METESGVGEGLEHAVTSRLTPHPLSGTLEFDALYRGLRVRLLRIAQSVTGSREEAEDIVQEAFGIAWRTRDTYSPERGAPYAWLAAIVRSRGIDRVRSRTREEARSVRAASLLVHEWHYHQDGVEACIAEEIRTAVRVAMHSLVEREKEVIALSFFGAQSHVHISAALRLPVGTVKARIRRGLMKLRDMLADARSMRDYDTPGVWL